MKFRTLVLAILFAACVSTTDAKSDMLRSIRPLQADVTLEYHGVTVEMRRNVCTAWATMYHGERVWATAGHCAHDGDTWIDGKPVQLLVVFFTDDNTADIAFYRGGPQGEQPFLFAQTVQQTQEFWSAGYPGGSKTLLYTRGVVSATADDEGLAVYQGAVAGGDSGSPVVDIKSGLVIGIVTQTLCDPQTHTWCPMLRGTTLENLKRVLN
jgi:hypothetical protein